MCGCAGVTGFGRVGGGVLVLAARRPFQTWLSESCLILLYLLFPFPFPTRIFPPSLYAHFFDQLPPRVRAIFRAGRRKARGPGARYMTRRPAAPRFLRPMWLRSHGGAAHYGPESS